MEKNYSLVLLFFGARGKSRFRFLGLFVGIHQKGGFIIQAVFISQVNFFVAYKEEVIKQRYQRNFMSHNKAKYSNIIIT